MFQTPKEYKNKNTWYLPNGKKDLKDVVVINFLGEKTDISALDSYMKRQVELAIMQGFYHSWFHPDYYDEDYLIARLAKMGLRFDATHTGDIQHQYLMAGNDYLGLLSCGHIFAIRGDLPNSNGWYCPECGSPASSCTSVETEQFKYLDQYCGTKLGSDFKPIEKEDLYKPTFLIGSGNKTLDAKLKVLDDDFGDCVDHFYHNYFPFDSKVPKSTINEANAFITDHPKLVNAFNRHRGYLLENNLQITSFYYAVMNSKDKSYFLAMDKPKKPATKKKPTAKKTPAKKPATKPKIAKRTSKTIKDKPKSKR